MSTAFWIFADISVVCLTAYAVVRAVLKAGGA